MREYHQMMYYKCMGPFVLALVVSLFTLSGGSLLWPKFTTAPRPKLLQQVHDVVVKTPPGEQAAQVLGVSTDDVQPINLGEVANTIVANIKTAAQKRAQTIIMAQVTAQLTNQYEKLSKDQQVQLQQIICKPTEAVKK